MDRIIFDKACVSLFKSMVPSKERTFEGKPKYDKDMFLLQGIVVDPKLENNLNEDVCSSILWYYGKDAFKLNQTFHKSLTEVAEISPEEHYFKQWLHYFTTYGYEALAIEGETAYIPNEKLEVPEDTTPIRPIVIKSITEDEIKVRIMNMLTANIAMKSGTIDDILNILEYLEFDVVLDQINNREARCAIAFKRNIPVKTSDDCLRVLNYAVLGNAMIVRSFRDMKKLKTISSFPAALDSVYNYLQCIPTEVIAKDFNKNRNLWFGYRGTLTGIEDRDQKIMWIRRKINEASRMNKKREKLPTKEVPTLDNFSSFLNANPGAALYEYSADDFAIIRKEENFFKLVKFMNYLREKIDNPKYKVYRIRNARTYVQENELFDSPDNAVNATCIEMLRVCRARVQEIMAERLQGKKVFIPSYMCYTLPTSEKQFVRGIPEGSRYRYDKNALIAIHWSNMKDKNDKELRVDLDLKAMSKTDSIGWDARFRDGSRNVLFSGDVTDAPIDRGGATEVVYFDKGIKEVFTLMVNNFNNEIDCPFEIIFEDTDKSKYNNFKGGENYDREDLGNGIIDNKIANKLTTIAKTGDKRQMSIGLYYNGQFYFTDTQIGIGSSAVASEYMLNYIEGAINKLDIKETLNDVLLELNLLVENKEDADIDLSLEAITADTFIDLFTKKEDIV